MAKTTIMDDLFALGAKLPWKLSIVLAIGFAIALHQLSLIDPPVSTGLHDLSKVMFIQIARVIGLIGQYIVPGVLLFGALAGFMQRRRGKDLLTQTRTKTNGLATLSWQQFEQLVGAIFREQGFQVEERGLQGPDGGVDLVLRKGGEKYLVQCKHWRSLKVGVPVVRELYGAIAAEGAVGGFVATTGQFTADAKRFVKGRNIELLDGQKLKRQMTKNGASNGQTQTSTKPPPPTAADCPLCNSLMVVRIAKKGPQAGAQFWGCRTYPACKGTRPL
ncbi:topoisomerase-like C4 zinc finger-containing protein [Spongiibacter sp. IMCC21906]|jgi:restriction system protein|uniref:restriction endonuclease n=1 Tax=Spongiibacter sp. IMCC21906 TaxID=1620392 RepID=UPI00062DF8C3|nr:restriction endonuclease [Spongiibacter sp. IMCC21906]AKH68794.1 topoisomerase-like C4 zinc finger-containing protein [Spongiibacter sp. IMCC21906]